MRRITPACAGNSTAYATTGNTGWDHPRVCGEQTGFVVSPSVSLGSPPRVRGTDFLQAVNGKDSGITPACAGNRQSLPQQTSYLWDHPRVCGEQSTTVSGITTSRGSPPRVRGTASVIAMAGDEIGITPACAGNSRPPPDGRRAWPDHPRVCGEQLVHIRDTLHQVGSPPRVRGTDLRRGGGLRAVGITPACAGNSPLYTSI